MYSQQQQQQVELDQEKEEEQASQARETEREMKHLDCILARYSTKSLEREKEDLSTTCIQAKLNSLYFSLKFKLHTFWFFVLVL